MAFNYMKVYLTLFTINEMRIRTTVNFLKQNYCNIIDCIPYVELFIPMSYFFTTGSVYLLVLFTYFTYPPSHEMFFDYQASEGQGVC